MGATSTHREPGISLVDFFMAEFRPTRWRFIDHAVVHRTEFYAAAEYTDGPDKGKVFAIVIKITYAPNDYFNITYREMDESVGPTYHNCPKRILDKLSPIDELYSGMSGASAQGWREKCRAKHDKPKPKAGDEVIFNEPIEFNNGDKLRIFEYFGGSTFKRPGGFIRYRISGWKDRKYAIVEKLDPAVGSAA